jgi:mannose PTS system EIIA component
MFGVVIVSQGGLAREILDAGRRIAGELPGFAAVSLGWEASLEEAREEVRRAVRERDSGDGVLILVDMFGSTPCNAALPLLDPGRVEIVTGVNLPMVVRLGCLERDPPKVAAAAAWLQAKAQASVCRPSEMRRPEAAGPCAPAPPEDCAGAAAAVGEGRATPEGSGEGGAG